MNCTASGKHWQKSKHSTEMKGMTASKLCSLLTCINSNLAHLCEHEYPKKMKMHEKNCTTYLQTASASHVLACQSIHSHLPQCIHIPSYQCCQAHQRRAKKEQWPKSTLQSWQQLEIIPDGHVPFPLNIRRLPMLQTSYKRIE